MQTLTNAKVEFGLIPHDHWFQPDWIDEERASAARIQMEKNKVIYGGRSLRKSVAESRWLIVFYAIAGSLSYVLKDCVFYIFLINCSSSQLPKHVPLQLRCMSQP